MGFVIWNVHPEMFHLGPVKAAWYGLLFALAFLAGQYVLSKIFKIEGKSEKDLEAFTFYIIIATVVGARLGHCLFYQPDVYLRNPIEILKIWEGGLASHGATVGILYATYLYSKRYNVSYLWILDRLVIVVALGGAFIRMGNLMNSEIIGKPTNQSYAFVFANRWIENSFENYEDNEENTKLGFKKNYTEKGEGKEMMMNDTLLIPLKITTSFDANIADKKQITEFLQKNIPAFYATSGDWKEHIKLHPNPKFVTTQDGDTIKVTWQAYGIPRHPSQLYESISTFLLFVLLLSLYYRYKQNTPEGLLFGLFVVILFTLRILYEYLKENQVASEDAIKNAVGMNIGQLLSVPMVIIGLGVLYKTFTRKQSK